MTIPFISIITVVFKDLDGLKKTTKALQLQNKDLFEHIIIDGGSGEDTQKYLTENSTLFSYWISEPDKGLYDAMNKGLNQAKGSYVWFLNAGDVPGVPNLIDSIYRNSNNEEVLYGNAVVIENNTQRPYHKKTPTTIDSLSFSLGMVVCHQAIWVRRDICLTYNLSYKIVGDIDWAIRIFKKNRTQKNFPLTFCLFEGGGISSQRKRKALIERFHCIREHYGIWTALMVHLKILFNRIF